MKQTWWNTDVAEQRHGGTDMVQQRHCRTDMVEHRHEEQTWWNRHCDIDMRNRHSGTQT